MDTAEDACQGDSGGPLVGFFHDQITPLELFPLESNNTTDQDVKHGEQDETGNSDDSNPTNDMNAIPSKNLLAHVDPNSMRLEDFIKLDMTPKQKINDKFVRKEESFTEDEKIISDIIRDIDSKSSPDLKDRIYRDVSSVSTNKHGPSTKRSKNLIWLNSKPKIRKDNQLNSISKRSLEDVNGKYESERTLKFLNAAQNKNKKSPDDDIEEYIFRKFNFHQPAEGELSESNASYDNDYRVNDSKMKAFLRKLYQTLPNDKVNPNRRKSLNRPSQRENSRHMDLSSDHYVTDESYRNNHKNNRRKNLGRFLWSVPNNDTKIAIESMINAGIQASILSALEHFKELQEQQNKFFEQQKVYFLNISKV